MPWVSHALCGQFNFLDDGISPETSATKIVTILCLLALKSRFYCDSVWIRGGTSLGSGLGS